MLDVHPAHHAASTWRDFFIHIATIVLGLLIAVSLEQTVEYIHHRRELADARRALTTERKINTGRFASMAQEFNRFVPILQGDLAIFVYLKQHPGKPLPESYGVLRFNLQTTPLVDGAWTAAQRGFVLDTMPAAEARRNSQLYDRIERLNQNIRDARAAATACYRFSIVDPDPTHLSPEQLDRQIDLVSEALYKYRVMANTQSNFHREFPDFTPAPDWAVFQTILHTPAAEPDILKRDQDAVAREVDTNVQYERSLDANEGTE